MDKIQAFTNEQLKKDVPVIRVGDTARVYNKIKEGNRERTQLFEGLVISKKNGGISETFTVRRIAYGVGVEKTFPLHSPNVEKVEIVRTGKDAFLCNSQASCQYRKSKAVICFQHISKEIANQKNHFIIVAVFICFCKWYIIFINQYYYLLMIMFFKKQC